MLRARLLCVLFICIVIGSACSESNVVEKSVCCKKCGQVSCVVIPEQAQPVEQYAADELVKYIKKMTGQPLAVVKESEKRPEGRAIILGRTKANLKAHNPDSWPIDTIYIGYGKGDITIIGQGDQGTLFAAYEFLRDQSCRWYMPGEVGECIPNRISLDLPNKPKKHTPSFRDRGWVPAESLTSVIADLQYWSVRNGLNAIVPYAMNFLGPDDEVKYPPELGYGSQKLTGHTIYRLLASLDHPRTAELFAAHPEWYPLINGKRVYQTDKKWLVQACVSNQDFVQEVAKHIIVYFRQNPRCWVFSVSPNDNVTEGWCECKNCLAMDWQDAKPDDKFKSDRYLKFVNQVARIVAKEYPDKYISFHAYATTLEPPYQKDLKPESNVIAEYANDVKYCLRHALEAPACEINSELTRRLGGWLKRGKVIYYDYPPAGYNLNIPTCFTHSYKRYLQYFYKQGVIGLSGENPGTWAGSALYYYLKARLLWDMESDVDQLVSEFCSDMYGPAAMEMEKFYTTFEQKLQEYPDHLVRDKWVADFDKENVRLLVNYLKQAREKANTPLIEKRVKMMQVAMNILVLVQMEKNHDIEKDTELCNRYKQICSEILQMVEEIDEPFPVVVTGRWFDKLKKRSAITVE